MLKKVENTSTNSITVTSYLSAMLHRILWWCSPVEAIVIVVGVSVSVINITSLSISSVSNLLIFIWAIWCMNKWLSGNGVPGMTLDNPYALAAKGFTLVPMGVSVLFWISFIATTRLTVVDNFSDGMVRSSANIAARNVLFAVSCPLARTTNNLNDFKGSLLLDWRVILWQSDEKSKH